MDLKKQQQKLANMAKQGQLFREKILIIFAYL